MTLNEAVKLLTGAGVGDAKSDVITLWCHVSGASRASVLFSMNDDISESPHFGHFMYLLTRRAEREPLQYLIGKWSFYGDEYTVTPACLIPRTDTEIIVDSVLEEIKSGARVADLCCGSGCIGIAVLRNTDAVCDSVDISEDALKIAQKNASDLGVSERIRFIKADITKGTPTSETYDLIVSNPPYIRHSVMDTLSPEVLSEPHIALDGGEDGLDFYRSILENYLSRLKEDGAVVFEIGFDQADDIKKLAESHSLSCVIRNDLENRPRAAILKRKQTTQL